jgi:hypothetical protein
MTSTRPIFWPEAGNVSDRDNPAIAVIRINAFFIAFIFK